MTIPYQYYIVNLSDKLGFIQAGACHLYSSETMELAPMQDSAQCETELYDLMTTDSWIFFNIIKVNKDWLVKSPAEWASDEDYKKAKELPRQPRLPRRQQSKVIILIIMIVLMKMSECQTKAGNQRCLEIINPSSCQVWSLGHAEQLLFFISMLKSVKLWSCQVVKLSRCQVVKSDPWDMLNNFCFHVWAQKSVLICENGNEYFWTSLPYPLTLEFIEMVPSEWYSDEYLTVHLFEGVRTAYNFIQNLTKDHDTRKSWFQVVDFETVCEAPRWWRSKASSRTYLNLC